MGETGYSIFGITFEVFYFSLIGIIMLTALLRYRHVYWECYNTKKYLFIGYVFYILGVSASFIGNASTAIVGFNIYETIGNYFLRSFFIRDEITIIAYEIASEVSRVDFMFMDKVVEESLELVGASALLVAGLYFFFEYKVKINK